MDLCLQIARSFTLIWIVGCVYCIILSPFSSNHGQKTYRAICSYLSHRFVCYSLPYSFPCLFMFVYLLTVIQIVDCVI
ncbi:hypothetical protein Lalb_Chr05g0221091 [Lupinus albus]|uniref:Uncharacterized protein n=1 Tax=Lupinus albus TaxID=3870 RepID=A0A6A4QKU1_LUPAL|nr:hypothetical protein Lalb_Chr05g0221091 [Lupinus albus]